MAKPRKEMVAETRVKLLAAARQAFGSAGYADASMDDFTAAAGLTRGALYHHFGDKKGLLQAVIQQIDAEMAERLKQISNRAPSRWQAFVEEWIGYVEMALEPEIQRIVFRDGTAVLGDISQWSTTNSCILELADKLRQLKLDGVVGDIDAEAAARLINGASSHAAMWIANSPNPEEISKVAVATLRVLLEGLRIKQP
jgi:AcrR family transcriptional regulator